jgi:uncharacterized protein YecA (UPF0149 family)
MWNPIAKLKEKFGGTAEKAKPQAMPKEVAAAAATAGGVPDMKELEKKGLMGKFFRHWKNPAFLAQMRTIAARMQADGVDVKDQKAVKAWIEKHQADIEAGKITAPEAAQAPKTFHNEKAPVGRNDSCPCGSGKKYKKCCGK